MLAKRTRAIWIIIGFAVRETEPTCRFLKGITAPDGLLQGIVGTMGPDAVMSTFRAWKGTSKWMSIDHSGQMCPLGRWVKPENERSAVARVRVGAVSEGKTDASGS